MTAVEIMPESSRVQKCLSSVNMPVAADKGSSFFGVLQALGGGIVSFEFTLFITVNGLLLFTLLLYPISHVE